MTAAAGGRRVRAAERRDGGRPAAAGQAKRPRPAHPNPCLASCRMDDQRASHTAAVRPAVGQLLKPTEVARRLGVSRTWLYAAAKDGRIPSVRIGGPDGPVRFVPEDLEAWLDEARAAWRPGDSSAATLRR